jgi:hypothetical protein
MAGMPREASVPLPSDRLPTNTTQLRVTTNLEVYWDRLMVIAEEHCPDATPRELTLHRSVAQEVGFAQRTTGTQRLPFYDYARRLPLWDTRHPSGFYTRFGSVGPLVGQIDDAVTIFGPGEEVHLEFAPVLEPAAPGWSRRFVLETTGWCKDMDLYTKGGQQLEPLPVRTVAGDAASGQRGELHRQFNTRFRSGT